MSNLTALQCLQLGTSLSQLQAQMASYKLANFDELSDDEKDSFKKCIKSLSDAAGMLIAYSVMIALEEADTSIKNLDAATQQINNVLKTIDKVQAWINMAGASFNLATALLNHNPKDIYDGIKQVVQTVEAAKS